jgi:hypothetical protein
MNVADHVRWDREMRSPLLRRVFPLRLEPTAHYVAFPHAVGTEGGAHSAIDDAMLLEAVSENS